MSASPVVCNNCHHSSPAGTLVCPMCQSVTASADDQPTLMISPHGPRTAKPAGRMEAGDVIGERYEVISHLGTGGMGSVYKARDRELDRVVAIKIVHPDFATQQDMIQRFKQEIILAREIAHKNVIRIFDLGTAPGLLYISMEYIDGDDLATVMARKRLTVDESISIMRQICRALDAAHSENIIHRDLKPQNIMISTQGRALVADFGLARSMEAPTMTRAGVLLGTPYYMSPEQAEGKPADARSDLFAAGIIFFQMLTGVIPFQADTILASLLKRTRESAPDPSTLAPEIPAAVSRVVMRCLASDPDQRYQTASEILADLEAVRSGAPVTVPVHNAPTVRIDLPVPEKPVREQPQALKPTRRLWIPATAVLLVAVLSGTTWWLQRAPAVGPRPAKPLTVLVADFANTTGESLFDGTLEPMFNFAVEGAGFVTTYNRAQARKIAGQLGYAADKLDESSARLIAVREGLDVVISGSLGRSGSGYRVSAKAVDAVSGKTIANGEVNASGREAVLAMMPNLASPIRAALGDATPVSAQVSAGETFTAGSLQAAHDYAVGQDLLLNGNFEQARAEFQKAITADPNFGRAYASMAVASLNLGDHAGGEKYFKLAISHLDRMTERERYRTRGAYYIMTGDQQKCIDEYQTLVKQFPSDTAGHNNLALCYTQMRMMPQAIKEMDRAVEISPKHAMFRNNLALFNAYGGNFRSAAEGAQAVQKLNPAYAKGYISMSFAHLGNGNIAEAVATYGKLAQAGGRNASVAAAGAADLAIYEGRFSDAVQLLEKGAADDIAAGDSGNAAAKTLMLAYAQLSRQQKRPAAAAASSVLAHTRNPKLNFLAARILALSGEAAKARAVSERLAGELAPELQAYAKLVEGQIAMAEGKAKAAIRTFSEGNRLLDTWIGRYDLGWAYLEAGAFAEADSEFDQCLRRRGEALSLFLDETPTFGYFPPVYYSIGRVREALKSSGYADSYRTYLELRGRSADDPLVTDIRRRLKQ